MNNIIQPFCEWDLYGIDIYTIGTGVVERFGTITQPYGIIFDKPKFTEAKFRDLCLKRAEEIVNKGKEVVVLSSGGTDSLAIIASFALIGHKPTVYNVKSFETNYNLVDFINNKLGIKYTVVDNLIGVLEKHDCVIVDGSCGDQITKSAAHYREDGTAVVTEMAKSNPAMIELIEKAVLPLKTIEELMWYLSFNIKWRLCARNMMPNYLLKYGAYELDQNKYYPFFETFSDWAYSNFDSIMKEKTYKPLMFELINEVFPKEYTENISKEYSIREMTFVTKRLVHTYPDERPILCLENGEYVYKIATSLEELYSDEHQ